MSTFSRSERVSGHVKKILTDILKKDINDPRLDMVTVTRVKLTSDLKIARIYFALAGSKKTVNDAEQGFKSARGFIKRSLARQLDLRFMPEIEFYYDETFDYASHIDELLRSIQTNDKKNIKSY
jgi:ribosome-binding factor A